MIPVIVAVCLIPIYLLILLVLALGVLSQLGRAAAAYRRRRARRRALGLLGEYERVLQESSARLAGYADLSRFVTANMLLAAHRERRRGVEARA